MLCLRACLHSRRHDGRQEQQHETSRQDMSMAYIQCAIWGKLCFEITTAKTGMLAGIILQCVSISDLSEVGNKAWQMGSQNLPW